VDAGRLVPTSLEVAQETWTTRVGPADTPAGGTRVTLTITHGTRAKGRLVRGRAAGPMAARTVDPSWTRCRRTSPWSAGADRPAAAGKITNGSPIGRTVLR